MICVIVARVKNSSSVMENSKKWLQVAVGILSDAEGRFLVALRSSSQDQGDLWEFPGGKVEAGESFYEALCRELKEEIGIEIHSADALTHLTHHYPSYSVELNAWKVRDYSGVPTGMEGQLLQWVRLEELQQLKLPGANEAILKKLSTNY